MCGAALHDEMEDPHTVGNTDQLSTAPGNHARRDEELVEAVRVHHRWLQVEDEC